MEALRRHSERNYSQTLTTITREVYGIKKIIMINVGKFLYEVRDKFFR
jgi:hypothetical protein